MGYTSPMHRTEKSKRGGKGKLGPKSTREKEYRGGKSGEPGGEVGRAREGKRTIRRKKEREEISKARRAEDR